MSRGTKGNGKMESAAPTAYVGTIFTVPNSNTTANYARVSDAQGYRQVAKYNQEDKQTGSYQRYTARDEVTTGQMYRGRGQKEYGVKDEYKTTDTFKVGDKSGYTEYYREERMRNVSYGGGIRNAGSGGKAIDYGGSKNSYGGGGGNYNSYGGGYDSYDDDSD